MKNLPKAMTNTFGSGGGKLVSLPHLSSQ